MFLISQRVLLAHISTLLTDLNDVRRSVCLDLDTKSKLLLIMCAGIS